MKDFNPKGFIKVGEINGVPIHAKTRDTKLKSRIIKVERPELKRKTRVNPNLLNMERPSNGPLERPSNHHFTIETGSEAVPMGGGCCK